MKTSVFWRAALIRAARTMAQAALALIPAAATITEVNWLTVLGTAALAGVVSILTSVATGLPEAEPVESAEPVIEYRYLDENGVPVDGHYMLVHNVEEEECEACNLSQYIAEGEPKGGDGDETA